MTFEQQDSGAFLGVASDRALAYADGDNDKLAAVCFAAFLNEWGIGPIWLPGTPLTIVAANDTIGVRADTGTDPETFTIADSGEDWTLAARVLAPAHTDTPFLVLLVGLTSQIDLAIEHHGPALPARAFLRLSDWLTQFNDRKDIAA